MKVKDICNLQNGRAFKPDDWGTEGLPIIRIQNLNDETAPFNYYAGEYSSVHEVNDGELLFSWSGTPGTSFGAFRWYRGKGILNQHIFRVIPKIAVDKEYLKYALNGNIATIISKAHGGVGLQHITKKELDKIEIPIVSEQDQKEIVSILQTSERVIDQRRGELEKLDDLIKARFVELFGDPITNPKGWDICQLNDCLERIDNGKSFVCSDKPRQGDYPAVLKLSAATYGDYRPAENKALLDENQFVEGAEIHSGDLLFTRKNTPELVGMAAYVHKTPEKLMMPDLIFRLVTNGRMNPVFLWQLINCKQFRPVIQSISGGSAKSMSNISKERLGKVSVICPPIEIQNQLVLFIAQVDKSKAAVQAALDKAQLLFDSLMQQYFG